MYTPIFNIVTPSIIYIYICCYPPYIVEKVNTIKNGENLPIFEDMQSTQPN